MTRSVEIPEDAVEKALFSLMDDGHNGLQCDPTRDFEVSVRAALATARPYLAPAGDGGLREALENLADNADHHDTCSSLLNPDAGYECSCLLADIRVLLAAHPAAPAVPQPVDREALVTCLVRQAASSPAATVGLRSYFEGLADAVLAVLAGEQEQGG